MIPHAKSATEQASADDADADRTERDFELLARFRGVRTWGYVVHGSVSASAASPPVLAASCLRHTAERWS